MRRESTGHGRRRGWVALGDGSYALNPRVPAGDGQERIVPLPYTAGKTPTRFLGLGPLRLSGRDVADVHLVEDHGRMALGITFTELGARRNLAFTGDLLRTAHEGGIGRMAIVCNGIVRSDPVVREPIGKDSMISGTFSSQEIEDLRRALRPAGSGSR